MAKSERKSMTLKRQVMAYMRPEMRWTKLRWRIEGPQREKLRRRAVCIVPTV